MSAAVYMCRPRNAIAWFGWNWRERTVVCTKMMSLGVATWQDPEDKLCAQWTEWTECGGLSHQCSRRLGRVNRGTQGRCRLHRACGPESLGTAAGSRAGECRTCQAPLQEAALRGWG